MSVLDRFRRIERSRREAPAPAADPEVAERIEGLERPGTPPPVPAASGADLDRFAPPAPAPVELLPADEARRPFTRCMRCGMDHNAFATECTGCGASLDTPAQREFNERLWRERQAERAEEARREAEREAARGAETGALAASRRAMGEAIAREVGERERQRLEREDLGGGRAFADLEDALGWAAGWIVEGARRLWRLVSPGPR